jgi:hypothetical protein
LVKYGGQRFDIHSPDGLTFGRAATCTIRLDPDDLGISRLAGSVESESGTWWVTNRSAGRPFTVADDIGIRILLAPGRRVALGGPVTVIVDGSSLRHAIEISIEPEAPERAAVAGPGGDRDAGLPTFTAEGVVVNEQDRLALVALFAGYLEPFPRYDPHPRSYADAAAHLGWSRTTLVKRIEYLRTRLTNAGVPNLLGETALPHLAEWVLATGVLLRSDLELLRRHGDGRGRSGPAGRPL